MFSPDSIDLVPEEGKHAAYDEIQAEIAELEKRFKAELKTLQKEVE